MEDWKLTGVGKFAYSNAYHDGSEEFWHMQDSMYDQSLQNVIASVLCNTRPYIQSHHFCFLKIYAERIANKSTDLTMQV